MPNNITGATLSGVSCAATIVANTTIDYYVNIISVVIAILSGIVSLCFTIYKIVKSVKEGKFNKDDLEELKEDIQDIADDISQGIEIVSNKEDNKDGDTNK